MKSRKNDLESGFTLIEVIITIVIIAVVAAMMTAYFGTGITQSSLPIFRLKASAKLNAVMENIAIQYGQYPHWQANTTYAAGAIILPTPLKRTGLLYTTTGGGTSGTTEPTWPLTIDGTSSDGIWTTVWTTGAPTAGAAPALVLSSWQSDFTYPVNAVIYENVSGGWLQYLCTNCNPLLPLKSGTVKPETWPTTSGVTVPETTPVAQTTKLIWQYVGYAPTYTLALNGTVYTGGLTEAIANAATCTAANCDNKFGRYRIIDNKFIRFLSNNEDPDPAYNPLLATNSDYGKYLKVTIGLHSQDADADKAATLTTLFVLR
jgi:prepilin-type N-terminal cleavage/methylation domain-containing protein